MYPTLSDLYLALRMASNRVVRVHELTHKEVADIIKEKAKQAHMNPHLPYFWPKQ